MKRALRGSPKANRQLMDRIAQSYGYKDHQDAFNALANEKDEKVTEVKKEEVNGKERVSSESLWEG